MLSSAKIGTSSWRYYTNGVACAATEYYLGVGEAPGRWHGRGLGELGLVVGDGLMNVSWKRCSPVACTRGPGSGSVGCGGPMQSPALT